MSAWWQSFFDEDALWLYSSTVNAERTEQEVAGIVRLLRLREGARLADLGCGSGRHSIALSRRGMHVSSLDYSSEALKAFRSRAASMELPLTPVRGDLRALPWRSSSCDAAISIFSTLGYENDESTIGFLTEARRILRPQGRLLVEVGGRDAAVRTFSATREWYEIEGRVVRVERRMDLAAGEERAVFFYDRGEGTQERHFRRRLYTPTELARMLTKAGFSKISFHGDWEGSPLGLDSAQLIAVARA